MSFAFCFLCVCVCGSIYNYEWMKVLCWLRRQRNCLHCRKPGLDPWVRKIPWRREWLPTPLFLPGEFHGQRSLAGHSPWGHKALGTTEWLTLSLSNRKRRNCSVVYNPCRHPWLEHARSCAASDSETRTLYQPAVARVLAWLKHFSRITFKQWCALGRNESSPCLSVHLLC